MRSTTTRRIPTPAELAAAELAKIPTLQNGDFEFIEIHNQGTTAANLVGVQLTDGVDFDFFNATSRTLPAGGYTVVVRNKEAFQLRYGNQISIAGVFDGNLDNTGEDMDLSDGAGTTIFSTMIPTVIRGPCGPTDRAGPGTGRPECPIAARRPVQVV